MHPVVNMLIALAVIATVTAIVWHLSEQRHL